ncbi:MAG: DUF5703 family protein [Kineosporiaceae bacterium]
MRPSPTPLPAATQYEYRVVSVPRGTSRAELRRRLTEDAEYGRWELARTRVYLGGGRKVWLRRRTMRVASTL